MVYTLLLLLSLLSLFGLQMVALKSVSGRTTKSESNFFSSIARIQTGVRDKPDLMLLGSSITGRFPDRSSGFAGVTNLGCDGGNALDALRAMDVGMLPTAPTIIIEGNTLYRSIGGRESEVARAIKSPWFRIGRKIPLLGATARPSAFIYSKLLAGKIGNAEGAQGSPLPIETNASVVLMDTALPVGAQSVADETSAILRRMQEQGIHVMIVIIPPGADADSPNILIPREVSKNAAIPLLDLATELPPDAVILTDGVHMAPESAAATLRSILDSLKQGTQ